LISTETPKTAPHNFSQFLTLLVTSQRLLPPESVDMLLNNPSITSTSLLLKSFTEPFSVKDITFSTSKQTTSKSPTLIFNPLNLLILVLVMLFKNLFNLPLKLPQRVKRQPLVKKLSVVNKLLVVVLNVRRLRMKQKLKKQENFYSNSKHNPRLLSPLVKPLPKLRLVLKQPKLRERPESNKPK